VPRAPFGPTPPGASASRPATLLKTAPTPTHVTAPAGCVLTTPTTSAGYAMAIHAVEQGGDATLSVRLPTGRVAWIFADTLFADGRFLHSTVIMQSGGCFTAVGAQFLPSDPDGTYWWPEAATDLPDGTVLVVAGDGFGPNLRAAVAREKAGALVFDHWLATWPQPWNGVSYSAALLVDGRTLLVYGTSSYGTPFAYGKQLWLASVPIASIADAQTWHLPSAPLWGNAGDGVDTAVGAWKDGRGYHVLSLRNGVYGDGAVISLDSAAPSGPFAERVRFTYNPPGQLRYNVAVHPEARLAGGGMLVSINNNWADESYSMHAWGTYQPSFFTLAP